MADKTFGFKVTDEVYDRAKMVVDASGLSSKEWFENALAMYEVKSLQSTAPEFARNLNELELHTTRIYDLVVNMVQQSMHFKDSAVQEVAAQLTKKEALVNELQEKLQTTKEYVATLETENKNQNELLEQAQGQLEESRKSIENSQLLISEYKEKNDSLTGLVAKYQGYAEENEQLKTVHAREKNELIENAQNEKNILEQALKASETEKEAAASKVRQLEDQLAAATVKAEQDVSLLTERHELALERALVQVEREYQQKLQEQLDKYNDRVAELQAENDRIRSVYEEKLNQQIEQEKK